MNLHAWIEKNILTVTGTLNSCKVNREWFHTNGFVDIYKSIFNKTSFLDDLKREIKLTERLYYVYNDINTIVNCTKEDCHNPVSFSNFFRGHLGYCSVVCSVNDSKTKEKCKKTCLERYGVENIFQSEEIKKKLEKTI